MSRTATPSIEATEANVTEVQPAGCCWRFDPFELNEGTRELSREGALLRLEPKPLNLLMYLIRRPGELVTKEELIEAVWAGRVVTDNVVTRCVTKLRDVFGGEGQALIKTVHGYGYRFTGEVQRVDAVHALVPRLPELAIGESPAGLPDWVLVERLGFTGDVWLGRHRATGAQRVFKFACDAQALTSIKREITLFRLLRSALAEPLPVVEIVDWNVEDTPSYIEFEHHPLGSLRDWLTQRGGLAELPLSERLGLIAEVANAVSSIHAVGVLHKDLKPANVIVSGNARLRGRLLLSDFGSGRVDLERIDALEITRLGFSESQIEERDTASTLMYTAPEVLSGRLPTMKADIYALGVMLYQFVVGDLRRPLAPGWERDVRDELLREDIARAADIQPEHRLADAAELAQRLRTLGERRARLDAARHDAQLREQALREAEAARQALERARARRHWTYALVASLLAGFALALWLYVQEREAEQRASAAAGTAYAINAFLNDDLLAAADPYLAGGGRNVTVSSILSRASERLGALEDQPMVHAQLSLTIGQAYANLGLVDEARNVYLAALDAARGRLSPQSGEMQTLLRRLAWLAVEDTRYAEARTLFDELHETALDLPQRYRADGLLRARYGLARLDYEQGFFARAVQSYTEIIAAARERGLDNPWLRREIEWDMANALLETYRWDRAERLFAGVESFFAEQLGSDNPRLFWVRINHGQAFLMRERFAEAEQLFGEVCAQTRASLGDSHPVTMICTESEGLLQLHQGDAAAALAHFESVLVWRMQYRGARHDLTRRTMMHKAQALIGLGRMPEAIELLGRARDLSAAQLGADHPHSIEITRLLAEAHAASGEVDQAQALFERILALGVRRLGANDRRIAWTHFGLGRLLQAEAKPALARRHFEAALAAFQAGFGEDFSMVREIRALLDAPDSPMPARIA